MKFCDASYTSDKIECWWWSLITIKKKIHPSLLFLCNSLSLHLFICKQIWKIPHFFNSMSIKIREYSLCAFLVTFEQDSYGKSWIGFFIGGKIVWGIANLSMIALFCICKLWCFQSRFWIETSCSCPGHWEKSLRFRCSDQLSSVRYKYLSFPFSWDLPLSLQPSFLWLQGVMRQEYLATVWL